MTSLIRLIAFNMKEKRRILGISQAALAERISTSTHYIAMIELGRKTPSLLMLERIAAALEIDPPELFSIHKIPDVSLKKLQKAVLLDLEIAVAEVINDHLKKTENWDKFQEILLP